MSGQLNPTQFEQGQLIDPSTVPLKQPHQMSRMEFSQRPDVLWHASGSSDIEDLRASYVDAAELSKQKGSAASSARKFVAQGFHAGTLEAATDRVTTRGGVAGSHFHPVQIAPEAQELMQNTVEEAHNFSTDPDDSYGALGEDMIDKWDADHHHSYYKNAFEDRGSVSAILESPYDVKTHTDYVDEALRTPGRIPSGAARWEAEQRDRLGTGFRGADVDIHRDLVTGETRDQSPYAGPRSLAVLRGYRDPLESASTRVWGRDEGEQQTLFNEDQYRRR